MKHKGLYGLIAMKLGVLAFSITDNELDVIIKFVLQNYSQCNFCNTPYKNNGKAFCCDYCAEEYYKQMGDK